MRIFSLGNIPAGGCVPLPDVAKHALGIGKKASLSASIVKNEVFALFMAIENLFREYNALEKGILSVEDQAYGSESAHSSRDDAIAATMRDSKHAAMIRDCREAVDALAIRISAVRRSLP